MAFDLLLLFFLHSFTSVTHARVLLLCGTENAALGRLLPRSWGGGGLPDGHSRIPSQTGIAVISQLLLFDNDMSFSL